MEPVQRLPMPSKEVLRRWREGHRRVSEEARRERMQMTPEQRLGALEMLYQFFKQMWQKAEPHPPCERWIRYKQKWLQKNRD
ncbi:MAG: hypothetical protein ABDI19_01475 [Armatimonadota bacterium]